MHVVSVNVGRPTLLMHNGRPFSTAINRKPAAGLVELGVTGFDGDRVSNLKHHGGPDKAACCYAHEHYDYWRQRLNREMPVPSFGENLTTCGLLEDEVAIGDVFRIGGTVVQVTQPRQPCSTLANKHGLPQLPKWINELGYTGFYVRVLQTGAVACHDGIVRLERANPEMTVARAMRILLGADAAEMGRLLDVPALSAAWKQALSDKLAST